MRRASSESAEFFIDGRIVAERRGNGKRFWILSETETGKTPDFKEAILEVDALKKIAKELQELKMKADALKDKTTEEERKKLAEEFSGKVNSAIERLSKSKKELNDTMVAVDAQYKDALKGVREKLIEADGEFEAISRR